MYIEVLFTYIKTLLTYIEVLFTVCRDTEYRI